MVKRLKNAAVLLLCCVAAATSWRHAPAQEASSQPGNAVETAREALREQGRLPWYDAEQDDVRVVNLPPEAANDFTNRNSRWSTKRAEPKPVQTPQPQNWTFPSLETILTYLFWIVLSILVLALLVGLVWLLVKAYLEREAALADETLATATDDADERDRIESLPFVMARPRGDLLDEAQAAYEAGDYRRAVIYLFSYVLIHLDKHQQIRLARGKTNRQYLRELRPVPEIRGFVEQTMHAFEDVFFGDHALSRQEFEAVWRQLDHFHQRVEQVAV